MHFECEVIIRLCESNANSNEDREGIQGALGESDN